MSKIPSDLLAGWDVVVIDDEPDSLEVARYILDFYGANVLTATNGQEGITLVEQAKPHFVISDLSMPEMDGWGIRQRLKINSAGPGYSCHCPDSPRHARRPRTRYRGWLSQLSDEASYG